MFFVLFLRELTQVLLQIYLIENKSQNKDKVVQDFKTTFNEVS